MVRDTVLKAHPNLPAILDPVFGTLTLPTLQSLNAKIAIDGSDARTVAARYLETLAK